MATTTLAFHGSSGTPLSIRNIIEAWKITSSNNIHTVQGPFDKEDGYCWWNMPPSVRSSTASTYEGYEISQERALKVLDQHRPDLVVGHSQGAILLAALLANRSIVRHPPLGYVFNGVAWPNPYTTELESLNGLDGVRVLLIVGVKDRINPPEQALRLQDSLTRAGAHVDRVDHPGGHAVPTDEDMVSRVQSWIAQGRVSEADMASS